MKLDTLWLPILGYESLYIVSSSGEVSSLEKTIRMPNGGICKRRRKILRVDITPKGYSMVTLHKKGKRVRKYIHRIVAETFLENLENKSQVNHRDGNKQNNSIDNLEWCTPSENQLHSIYTLGNYPIRRGLGVYYREGFKKPWVAQISIKGARKHLGCFYTKREAIEAYKKEVKLCQSLHY